MHVSQSGLSMQIRQLEDALGHQLFDRRGRKLHLTEAGRIALLHADAIFATGDDLLATLDARGKTGPSTLRAGALATLSRNFQIAFFKPALQREDLQLHIESGTFDELLDKLSDHRLDVVLSNRAAPHDDAHDWVSHRIAEQPVSLVGPARYAGDRRALKTLLANEPLVVPTPDSSIRVGFDALVDRYGVRPNIVAEVDDMAMFRLVARSGIGLAVVPPIVVRDELESGRLVELRKVSELAETFYAVTLPRRFPHPWVRELITSALPLE